MERLFTLDAQFLFDAIVLALSMLVLFTAASYLFFNPVRDMLEKRKQRVIDEQETAKQNRQEAVTYKEEYEKKLKEINKEAEFILGEARKKAIKNEAQIVEQAKQEAARIIRHAHAEVELEKKHALDDMKREMIDVATLMAQKVVASSIDLNVQESLIDETLKELGEQSWQS